ncbi:hypothetical protein TRFO_05186 [Tritrichomonas foetus]|uniref:TPR Domain containing protein n=1 Tax=Tritrichomonas foetus TaxID=1144522 RepID=A0A1J4K9H1_9EUKA|nr:hypothetical protein TRFO_05186 [Tritrichomonas foetus]|eukprot:OHT07552.1 hypothetical protein TRFO_05186 [Tritrichomonas foetus]
MSIQIKYVRSMIIDHLQGNIPMAGEGQVQLANVIHSLRKIWNITEDDLTTTKKKAGTLTQSLSFLNDSTPLARQLCYMSAQDLQENDAHSAVLNIGRAQRLDPHEALTHCNAAKVYFKVGYYAKSLAESLKAIEYDPYYTTAYIRLGLACWALNRHDEAMTAYNQGLKISPGNPVILHNIAVLQDKNAKPPAPYVELPPFESLNLQAKIQDFDRKNKLSQAIKSESENKSKPRPKTKPNPQPNPQQNPQPNPQSKPQPDSQPNPQPNPQSKPQQNPQPNPQSKPQPKPQSKPQPKAQAKSQPKTRNRRAAAAECFMRSDIQNLIKGINVQDMFGMINVPQKGFIRSNDDQFLVLKGPYKK